MVKYEQTPMNGFTKVGPTTLVPEGEMKKFDVGGIPVLVVNIGGNLFAVSDTCTHKECSLSGGTLEDGLINCPCHGSQFDAKTGEVKSLPATVSLKSYEVKVENNEIFIKI